MILFKSKYYLKEIIYSLRSIAKGDLEQKISLPNKGEIGALAEAFNQAVAGFKQRAGLLERQVAMMQSMLDSMLEAVIALDCDTRIIMLNPSAERIFAIGKQDAEGKFFLEAVRNNEIAGIFGEVIKNGSLVSREVSLVWPMQKTFQINASPITDAGKISGCLAVIHDITEIRRLERMRSDFVANVSHELKTPLTSVKGFVETLLEGALDDKENARSFLKIIKEHTDRLDNLINDLLDLSHLESEKINIRKKEISFKELADRVLLGFKSQLKKKSIEAKNDIPISCAVCADPDKMEQVFTNLLDNAIKFNRPNGQIKLSAQILESGYKFLVEDSGLGIPEKDLPRIFERFYRVDKARSRELGGTGLGLSIVKHIVELHGGEVGVESTEGLGSKFWFSIPK